MRKPRFGAAVRSMLGAALLVAACMAPMSEAGQTAGAFPQALVDAAKKEGTFTLYHTQIPDAMRSFVQVFEKKFGLRGEQFRAPGYDMQQKYVAEGKSGTWVADVVQLSDITEIQNLIKLGMVGEYAVTSDKEYPDNLKIKGMVYSLHTVQLGITYNADQVKPEDARILWKWEGLLDPRWKGKMGIVYPTGGSTWMPNYMWVFAYPERFGLKFVEGLAAQKPTIFTSNVTAAERLAAGEVSLLAHLNDNTFYAEYQKGAPIRLLFPSPTPVSQESLFLSPKPPHPNAGKLFVEWALSKEGQEVWMSFNGGATGRSDVNDPRTLKKESWFRPPTELFLPKDWNDFSQRRASYLETWRKIFNYNP